MTRWMVVLALVATLAGLNITNASAQGCGPYPVAFGPVGPYAPFGAYPGALGLGLPPPLLAPLPYVPPTTPVLQGYYNGVSLVLTPRLVRTPGWVYAQAAYAAGEQAAYARVAYSASCAPGAGVQ